MQLFLDEKSSTLRRIRCTAEFMDMSRVFLLAPRSVLRVQLGLLLFGKLLMVHVLVFRFLNIKALV